MLPSTKSSPKVSLRQNNCGTHDAANLPSAQASTVVAKSVGNTSEILDLMQTTSLSNCRVSVDMAGLMDTGDLLALSLLLERGDVKLETLSINVSEQVDAEALKSLLAQLKAHPELRSLHLRVNGRDTGPIPRALREAIASSADALRKGGAAIRDMLFRELDDRLHEMDSDTVYWTVGSTLEDFRRMRLDDTASPLPKVNAESLSYIATRLRDKALMLAAVVLSKPIAE